MKKILSVVVVFVMLVAMSASAFAVAPNTAQNEDGSWTTAGSDAAYANSMMTILAYTKGAAISVDSIQYIDQTVANANGDYSFANYLPKVDPTGAVEYTVKVGGQKVVDGPLDAGIIKAAVSEDKTATIKVVYVGSNKGADVVLTPAEGEALEFTTTASNEDFVLEAAAGTYDVSITKAGHTKYVAKDVNFESMNGQTYTLYCGDADQNDIIGVLDIDPIIGNLDATITAENVNYDVNDDGFIGVMDIDPIIGNLNAVSVLPADAE